MSRVKYLLACGDRNYKSIETIREWLTPFDNCGHRLELVHGGCKGADRIAGNVVLQEFYWNTSRVHEVPAQCEKYGDAAGPIRNQKMLDDYQIDLVLAFHDDITNSIGTADMVGKAHAAGVPVVCIVAKSDGNGVGAVTTHKQRTSTVVKRSKVQRSVADMLAPSKS
jgi:hypothetical protein